MAINNNDSRVRKTKKLIRKGLTQLSKDKNIYRITVKELTDLIDINRGTFYLHYKDVPELVRTIEDELYDEFRVLSDRTTVDVIKNDPVGLLESFCILIQDNDDIVRMLVGANGDPQFAVKFGDIINDKVLAIFKELYPDLHMEPYSLLFEYCKFGVMGLIQCWLFKLPDWAPRKIAEFWLEILSRGLRGVLTNREKV